MACATVTVLPLNALKDPNDDDEEGAGTGERREG